MEFCVAQPITDYDVEVSPGHYVGLYSTYFPEPEKLALILVCTLVPFQYEPGSEVPITQCLMELDCDFEKMLNFRLTSKEGSISVRQLLVSADSVESIAVALLGADNWKENPFIHDMYDGDTDAFKQVIQARYLANKHYQNTLKRGAVKSKNQNVLAVNFSVSELSDTEKKFLNDAIESTNSYYNNLEEN